MTIVVIGKTTVIPMFDSSRFKNGFSVYNEYLGDYWFESDHEIWAQISSVLAQHVDNLVKYHMKNKMNEESYKEVFENIDK